MSMCVCGFECFGWAQQLHTMNTMNMAKISFYRAQHTQDTLPTAWNILFSHSFFPVHSKLFSSKYKISRTFRRTMNSASAYIQHLFIIFMVLNSLNRSFCYCRCYGLIYCMCVYSLSLQTHPGWIIPSVGHLLHALCNAQWMKSIQLEKK